MRRDEWLADFCTRIGADPPSEEEVEALLDLAATAAHSSERTAAPLACWAAGHSGRPAAELNEIAKGSRAATPGLAGSPRTGWGDSGEHV